MDKLQKLRELDDLLCHIFCPEYVYLHVKHFPDNRVATYKLDSNGVGGYVLGVKYRKYLPLYHEHELVIEKRPDSKDKTKYLLKFCSLDTFMDKMKEFMEGRPVHEVGVDLTESVNETMAYLTSICDKKHVLK